MSCLHLPLRRNLFLSWEIGSQLIATNYSTLGICHRTGPRSLSSWVAFSTSLNMVGVLGFGPLCLIWDSSFALEHLWNWLRFCQTCIIARSSSDPILLPSFSPSMYVRSPEWAEGFPIPSAYSHVIFHAHYHRIIHLILNRHKRDSVTNLTWTSLSKLLQ